MAEIVLTVGVPHTPLLWRLLTPPVPDDLTEVAEAFSRFATMLRSANPDVIVVVASDHFRQFFMHNMPAFLIGKADRARGTHPNEERAFGLPRVDVPLDRGLAAALLGERQLPDRFDFAYSNEPWLDHGFMIPLLYLTPDLDVPIVPIHTNTNAPPIPAARRFLELGTYLAEVVAGFRGAERVAVVGSGHLAFELGGPRQFSGSPSPDFDRAVGEMIRRGDPEELVELCRYEALLGAGNLTFQVLNFLVCLGAAGGGGASEVSPLPTRFGNEPFFAWEPG